MMIIKEKMVSSLHKSGLHILILTLGIAVMHQRVHAQSPNEPIDMKAMQEDLLKQSGLTRKEGMEAFKLFNQCRLKGYPKNKIWVSCMQPTYALRGDMPSNPGAAIQFAMQQTCIKSRTVAEAMVCGSAF